MKLRFHPHPYIFTLAAILSFWAGNSEFVIINQIWRTIFVSLGATAIIYWIVSFIVREPFNTGILASIFVVFFFYFEASYKVLELFLPKPNSAIIFIGLWLVFSFYFFIIIARSAKPWTSFNTYLNLTAIVFSLTPGMQILLAKFGAPKELSVADIKNSAPINIDTASLPDIYYMVLDGYGRQDILKEYYSFDNADFINELEVRGFYVADASSANYAQTYLSLGASLNAQYFKPDAIDSQSKERFILKKVLEESYTLQRLRAAGYKITAIEDVDPHLTLSTADEIIPIEHSWNGFEIGFFGTTFGKIWAPTLYEFTLWQATSSQLSVLSSLPLNSEQPRFTFAHFLNPHPPFVFDSEGGFVSRNLYKAGDGSHYGGTREEYIEGYRGQVEFINLQILRIIDYISMNSERPVVIILQGDHGPGSLLDWENLENSCVRERFSILNAYYFSDKKVSGELYKTISPVNTFRIILNQYTDDNLPPLQDKSFFSTWDAPYDFVDVSDQLNTCAPKITE